MTDEAIAAEHWRETIQEYWARPLEEQTNDDWFVYLYKICGMFRAALYDLGLSDTQAAELLWTSPRQIRRWLDPSIQRPPSAQVFIILKNELEKSSIKE